MGPKAGRRPRSQAAQSVSVAPSEAVKPVVLIARDYIVYNISAGNTVVAAVILCKCKPFSHSQ